MGFELDSVRKARKSVNQTEQRSTRVSSGARVFFDYSSGASRNTIPSMSSVI